MYRDEYQELEGEVFRVCREFAELEAKTKAATTDAEIDAVRDETMAKMRELMRVKDALFKFALKEGQKGE